MELCSSLSYPLKLTEREERLVEFPLCLWTTFRLIYIQEEPRTQSVKMVTINTMSISTRLPESIRGVHNAIMYSQHFLKWGPFHISYLPSSLLSSFSSLFPTSGAHVAVYIVPIFSISSLRCRRRPSIISSARSPHNSCQPDGRTSPSPLLSSPLFPSLPPQLEFMAARLESCLHRMQAGRHLDSRRRRQR